MTLAHPSDLDIAAYLSGGLSDSEREEVQAHLAQCGACRAEITTARRLLRTGPGRRPVLLVASLSAAAVLALVLPIAWSISGPPTDRERDIEPGAAPALQAVSPAEGSTVGRDSLRFTWRSEPGDLVYRLTIATSAGEAVWSGDTNDTTVVPPATLRLAPGGRYFWYVDALDAAGLSLTTGPRSLGIAP